MNHGPKSSVQDKQTPPHFLWAFLDLSCHQHTRHFSISHSHWQRGCNERLLQRAYNMLQNANKLCTICLHACDIMQYPFIIFPLLFCFWIISQVVYQSYGCLCGACATQIQNQFFIMFLHNPPHYASDITFNERNELLFCAHWVSLDFYRIWHNTACLCYQRAAYFTVYYRLSLFHHSAFWQLSHVHSCRNTVLPAEEEYAKACTVQSSWLFL